MPTATMHHGRGSTHPHLMFQDTMDHLQKLVSCVNLQFDICGRVLHILQNDAGNNFTAIVEQCENTKPIN